MPLPSSRRRHFHLPLKLWHKRPLLQGVHTQPFFSISGGNKAIVASSQHAANRSRGITCRLTLPSGRSLRFHLTLQFGWSAPSPMVILANALFCPHEVNKVIMANSHRGANRSRGIVCRMPLPSGRHPCFHLTF